MITDTNNINLLTIEDVSERLMCSPAITYRLLRSGVIKGFKVAGHWRITEESYAAFIKEQNNSQLINEV